jgi:putative ABC transport system permease protein
MWYLLKMALRNVLRNRRRSILAVLSVTIATMFIVFAQGMFGGIMGSMVRNYTRSETGHVRIATRGFEERARFFPVTETIDEPQPLIERIRSDAHLSEKVELVTERITFGVLLANEGNNKTVVAMAGDPEVEKDLLLLERSITAGGRYIAQRGEIIMGSKVAEALDFSVGDMVKVMTTGSDYALHLKKLELVGIFETGLNMLDDRIFQMHLEDARRLLRMGEGTQQILVMLEDFRDSDMAAAHISGLLEDPELTATSWTQLGSYYNLLKMQENVYGWGYLIVALLGAFIISNIMMMVVLERRKEIGIMKSMGFTRRQILWLFVMEGIMLGLAGSVFGVGLGLVLNVIFHHVGMDFSSMLASFNFPMDNVIYFTIDVPGALRTMLMAAGVSALVSLLPSLRAARMNAIDAIRGA